MRVQVVHAHPRDDSYNHALFRAMVDSLTAAGHQVTATDLYRSGFVPAMRPEERATYYAPPYDESQVAELAHELRRAEAFIACFPHWWFAMPAMMKGYFDRVWGPGIAFDHDPAGGRIRPLLTGLKLFGVVTSYGAPWWLVRLAMGDPGRKVLLRALKTACAPQAKSFWLAHYDMDRSTPESRMAFIETVRARVARL